MEIKVDVNNFNIIHYPFNVNKVVDIFNYIGWIFIKKKYNIVVFVITNIVLSKGVFLWGRSFELHYCGGCFFYCFLIEVPYVKWILFFLVCEIRSHFSRELLKVFSCFQVHKYNHFSFCVFGGDKDSLSKIASSSIHHCPLLQAWYCTIATFNTTNIYH
jgi:hypothetical protein